MSCHEMSKAENGMSLQGNGLKGIAIHVVIQTVNRSYALYGMVKLF